MQDFLNVNGLRLEKMFSYSRLASQLTRKVMRTYQKGKKEMTEAPEMNLFADF